eukprot:508533-Rhodomonas_salina.1
MPAKSTAFLVHTVLTRSGMLFDLAAQERAQGGPVLHGTVPEDNRFHDDKTTYTGVHANGTTRHVTGVV